MTCIPFHTSFQLEVEDTAATVANVTSNPESLESLDIVITTEVVATITDEAASSPGTVRDNFLETIDQLMSADRDAVLESQEQGQTSSTYEIIAFILRYTMFDYTASLMHALHSKYTLLWPFHYVKYHFSLIY